MRMERRGPQKLNRNQSFRNGLRADKTGMNSKSEDLKLELQSNSWLRIGLAAKNTEKVFTNLFCHFNMENLREGFHALDGSKAVGIDGITKGQYGRNLEGNLNDLLTRLHKGTYRPQPKCFAATHLRHQRGLAFRVPAMPKAEVFFDSSRELRIESRKKHP